MKETFREDLRCLINRYSLENASNTPDFILGEYMQNCLNAFEIAVQQRETWYGRDAKPSHLNAEKGERCPDRAIELLRLILPMAKGYAHTNNVGNNQAFCDAAEQYLIVNEGKSSAMGEDKEAKHYKLGTFKNILGRG